MTTTLGSGDPNAILIDMVRALTLCFMKNGLSDTEMPNMTQIDARMIIVRIRATRSQAISALFQFADVKAFGQYGSDMRRQFHEGVRRAVEHEPGSQLRLRSDCGWNVDCFTLERRPLEIGGALVSSPYLQYTDDEAFRSSHTLCV